MRASLPYSLRPFPEIVLVATNPDDIFTLNANSQRPKELAEPIRFTLKLDTSITLTSSLYLAIIRVDRLGTEIETHRVTSNPNGTDIVVVRPNLGDILGTGENFIARVVGAGWTGKTATSALYLGLDR